MKILITSIFLVITSAVQASVDLNVLHSKMKAKHIYQYEYKHSKPLIFSTVDNNQGIVCSVYTPLECRTQNKSRGFNLNIEHTWPQSKGAKFFPAQGDMHHLYVTSKESNSMRANYPFCIVWESEWSKQGSRFGFNEDLEDCFEPVDTHKGNVARAMFYFSVRYKKPITQKQETLFRAWNKLDPVDEIERLRNIKIEQLQGNRNPFIDDESLVESIASFTFL